LNTLLVIVIGIALTVTTGLIVGFIQPAANNKKIMVFVIFVILIFITFLLQQSSNQTESTNSNNLTPTPALTQNSNPNPISTSKTPLNKIEPSDVGSNYTILNSLLASHNFRKADEETYQIMLLVTSQQQKSIKINTKLQQQDIQDFPCKDLRAIDKLWLSYSEGIFGFSVQRKILGKIHNEIENYRTYTEQHKISYELLEKRLGWNQQMNYDLGANLGHLPSIVKTLKSEESIWHLFVVNILVILTKISSIETVFIIVLIFVAICSYICYVCLLVLANIFIETTNFSENPALTITSIFCMIIFICMTINIFSNFFSTPSEVEFFNRIDICLPK
jgi:hypothetical protein